MDRRAGALINRQSAPIVFDALGPVGRPAVGPGETARERPTVRVHRNHAVHGGAERYAHHAPGAAPALRTA